MGEYIVTIITLLPLVGAIYLAVIGRGEKTTENDLKWTALVFSLATFILSLSLAIRFQAGGHSESAPLRAIFARSLRVSARAGYRQEGISSRVCICQ